MDTMERSKAIAVTGRGGLRLCEVEVQNFACYLRVPSARKPERYEREDHCSIPDRIFLFGRALNVPASHAVSFEGCFFRVNVFGARS
jgi:hypothetical protein